MKKIKFLKNSFSKTIIIWMVVLSTLPLLGFGTFAFVTFNRLSSQDFSQRNQEIVHSTNALVETELRHLSNQMFEMTQDQQLMDLLKKDELLIRDEAYLSQVMHTVLGRNSNRMSIRLIQKQGLFAYSTNSLPQLYDINQFSSWGIFRLVKQEQYHPVFLNHYQGNNGLVNAISIVHTVRDSANNELGYLVMDISRSYLQSLLNVHLQDSVGIVRYIITSDKGHIIYNDSPYLQNNSFIGSTLQNNIITVDNEALFTDNIVSSSFDELNKIYYYGIVSKSVLTDNTRFFTPVLFGAILILVIVSGSIGYALSKRIVKPIVDLSETMKEIRGDKSRIDYPAQREDEIDEIGYQLANMMERIQEYHLLDKQKQDLLRQTEIKTLLLQINPHFLYNTLDSIKWLSKLNGVDSIYEIVTELSDMLKSSMDFERSIVTVAEEMSAIKSYIFIQKIRYQDRFEYDIVIEDDILDYEIPKFILQPIVENALVHGIEGLSEKGVIAIHGWSDESLLCFSIRDNGGGFDFDVHEYLEKNKLESIGLSNVNRRLQLHYGKKYGLEFRSEPNQGTLVYIRIPKKLKVEN